VTLPEYVIVFVFGAVIGSFLNVCIYRIPQHKSIVFPSSRCPSCGSPIKAYDNIPIISFLALGGKCRECKGKISVRYPFVELLNGILYMVVLWRFGAHWHTLFYLVFVSLLIVITFIDLDHQMIPDSITLPGMVIGIVLGSFLLLDPYDRSRTMSVVNSLAGMLFGGVLYYLIAVLSRGGMGGGDIKMMGMLGSVLGWKGVIMTTFTASLTGSIVGIMLMVLRGKGRKTKIPFGPFLALGALVSLLFGQELLGLYLHDNL
jgi:leader peptidase (prepilin peptidase)/N-methyltransferase